MKYIVEKGNEGRGGLMVQMGKRGKKDVEGNAVG